MHVEECLFIHIYLQFLVVTIHQMTRITIESQASDKLFICDQSLVDNNNTAYKHYDVQHAAKLGDQNSTWT